MSKIFKSECLLILIKSLSKVTSCISFLMEALAITKSIDPAIIPFDLHVLLNSEA